MSNVFAKDHKPTGIEFLDLCPQIEILTVRFLKANVPKSYTNIYTIHIAKTARTICNCIEEANASYPSDSRRLKKRRALINEALDKIEVLIKELTRLMEVLPEIDPNKLNQLGQVLMKETELLKGWRDSTTRNRRKLKSIRRMVDEGTMTPERAVSSYFSWYGYQNHLDAHDTLRDADKLFYRLFHIWPKHRKKKKRKVFYR